MKYGRDIKEFPISMRELRTHYIMALGEVIAKRIELQDRFGSSKIKK